MHPLSTENKLPRQFYHSYSQDSSLFDEAIYPSIYGCDEEESEALDDDIDDDTDAVVIPTTQLALSQDSLRQLHATINPLDNCNDNGWQLYISTVGLVFALMQNQSVSQASFSILNRK